MLESDLEIIQKTPIGKRFDEFRSPFTSEKVDQLSSDQLSSEGKTTFASCSSTPPLLIANAELKECAIRLMASFLGHPASLLLPSRARGSNLLEDLTRLLT
jgi:hypothetical protein